MSRRVDLAAFISISAVLVFLFIVEEGRGRIFPLLMLVALIGGFVAWRRRD